MNLSIEWLRSLIRETVWSLSMPRGGSSGQDDSGRAERSGVTLGISRSVLGAIPSTQGPMLRIALHVTLIDDGGRGGSFDTVVTVVAASNRIVGSRRMGASVDEGFGAADAGLGQVDGQLQLWVQGPPNAGRVFWRVVIHAT